MRLLVEVILHGLAVLIEEHLAMAGSVGVTATIE